MRMKFESAVRFYIIEYLIRTGGTGWRYTSWLLNDRRKFLFDVDRQNNFFYDRWPNGMLWIHARLISLDRPNVVSAGNWRFCDESCKSNG